jgi:hypothetical protein
MEVIKRKNNNLKSYGIVFLKYRNRFHVEINLGKITLLIGF